MALPAGWQLELRTGGNDANGGGYDTGGTDYSQQDAAQLTNADFVSAGATTITTVTGGMTAAMIGNGINFVGVGLRRITAVTNANTFTVDANVAAATYTASVGGALATPGFASASANLTAGIDVWQKAGTYTVTSASTNIAGGCVSIAGGHASASNTMKWEGYNASRGDKGTRPVIVADGVITAFTLFAQAVGAMVDNIVIDGNSRTTSTGYVVSAGNRSKASRVKVQNTTVNGISHTGGACDWYRCEVTGFSGTAGINIATSSGAHVWFCEAYDGTTTGIKTSVPTAFVRCISSGNTTGSAKGFEDTGVSYSTYDGCIAYGNAGDGFVFTTPAVFVTNCTAEGNGGYGFNATAVNRYVELYYCSGYNNTTANVNTTNLPLSTGFVTLTGSPFTNAGAGDFSLNNTAGAGAACRAAGYPGLMPRGTTTGYLDIGAAQHADPSASLAGDGGSNMMAGYQQVNVVTVW